MTTLEDQLTLNALLHERYGSQGFAFEPAWDSTLASLLAHRSVRAYQKRSLPPGTLELLVAAAQSAATSSNLQTWSVVAVENPERKARLAQMAGGQAHIHEAPLFLVWLADLGRLERLAEARGLPHSGLDYLEMFVTAVVDAALAAQNAVVAAESQGLGTVYIGAMRNQPEEVAKELALPPATFAVFGLCVGYEDPEKLATVKPRLPQSIVLHREVYSTATEEAAATDYSALMADFYRTQGMSVGNWIEHSAQRVAGSESLSGRAHLAEMLGRLGFPLQ